MEAKDVLRSLRKERGLSQEELAEKIFVTRQAVSRWETGETLPTPETLQLLSALYDVSINTLLGSPGSLSVSAAACHWRTLSSAVNPTAP